MVLVIPTGSQRTCGELARNRLDLAGGGCCLAGRASLAVLRARHTGEIQDDEEAAPGRRLQRGMAAVGRGEPVHDGQAEALNDLSSMPPVSVTMQAR